MEGNFDFEYLETLNKFDSQSYITKYFHPLFKGGHAVYENGKYEIYDDKTLKSVYFNRLSKELNEYYFYRYKKLRTIVCELYKETLYDNKLNICPKLKAIYTPYEDIDEEVKTKLQIFLNYIREVLADNSEESYIYLLKWFSNALKGNKNDSCLYIKGEQGIGKSTISDFLKDFVVGRDLFLESGSKPLTHQFNSVLAGKLFVQFTELENFSTQQWIGCSSVLKRFITSNTYSIEAKYKDEIQIKNINNYIIDSNNDAIKDDNGRRYFILDISYNYREDLIYFGNIKDNCFNDEVANAFYSYMMEYNTDGFLPQKFPITKSKMNSFVNRMDSACKFLKDNYVLNNLGLNIKPKELYTEYLKYCKCNEIKITFEKIPFYEKLSHLGINSIKSGTNMYKVPFEKLKEIADKNKWIHEFDEITTDEIEELESITIKRQTEIIEKQNTEIEELKKQAEVNEKLEKQLVDLQLVDLETDLFETL